MITTVIFDFFGVVSSEVAPFWFGARFAREEAIRLKQEYMEPADHGDISKEELFARLSALSGEAAEDIEAEFSRLAVINRDTVEVIKALKGKYKVGLLSNAQAEWLEGIFLREDLHGLFDLEVSRVECVRPSRRRRYTGSRSSVLTSRQIQRRFRECREPRRPRRSSDCHR